MVLDAIIYLFIFLVEKQTWNRPNYLIAKKFET